MSTVANAVAVLKAEFEGYKDKANHAILNVENRLDIVEGHGWFGRHYQPPK